MTENAILSSEVPILGPSGSHPDGDPSTQGDESTQTLRVNEVYDSIQGEGLHAGLPCRFIRLAGCDLRCAYCDTPYALAQGSGRPMSVRDLLDDVDSADVRLVEITGGEPLLQPAVYPLMHELLARRHEVLLETNGHHDADAVPHEVVRIIDVKTPGSGMALGGYAANLGRLRSTDQIKFVIVDRADYEWARELISRHRIDTHAAAVLLSPAHGVLDPRELAEWIVADRAPVRLHVQVHKYIWGTDARGV